MNCCLRILSVLGYTDIFSIQKYVVCSVLLCITINEFVLQLQVCIRDFMEALVS